MLPEMSEEEFMEMSKRQFEKDAFKSDLDGDMGRLQRVQDELARRVTSEKEAHSTGARIHCCSLDHHERFVHHLRLAEIFSACPLNRYRSGQGA